MLHPVIRIARLHLRGLRATRSLNLPEDGLGWGESIPSAVLMGGVNGSGKTTLLNFITRMFYLLVMESPVRPPRDFIVADEALVDVEIRGGPLQGVTLRFLMGNDSFFEKHETEHCFGFRMPSRAQSLPSMYRWVLKGAVQALRTHIADRPGYPRSTLPSVLYIPSEYRALEIPEENFKLPGRMPAPDDFIYQWSPAVQWKDSLEARLYSARWEDLNAKEEGHPEEARHFEAYAHAFEEFTGGTKTLAWSRRGELLIEIRGEKTLMRHHLEELSSGEKQVLIILSELLLRWRPGSLVLLDEPELHLHPSWQMRLWEVLLRFLRQRGGQLIAATQSPHLFAAAEPGTKLLLGGTELE